MGPEKGNLCGLEPQLIKLEFIIYLPKLKVTRACCAVLLKILTRPFSFINVHLSRPFALRAGLSLGLRPVLYRLT